MTNQTQCPVCATVMSPGIETWHFECRGCGYESATLQPSINDSAAHDHIDEAARENGLRSVRERNFRKLLTMLEGIKPKHSTLLDVGCAHGWFLELAQQHYTVTGVEPDEKVGRLTAAKGLPVKLGYFPDVLTSDDRYDIIAFNDVIEHIPDIGATLRSCRERLTEKGVLVLNLPNSKGLFYRLSRALHRAGVKGFFNRLWQKDLPSPHVHYFNPDNLRRLLERHAFTPLRTGSLPVLTLDGLYTRIAYAGNDSLPMRLATYLGVVLSLPILKMLPSDIIYIAAEK